MTRVLAIVVAAGLIVAALVIRNAIDDDPGTNERTGATQVVCAKEVADACAALSPSRYEVVVEDAALTAGRLSTDESTDVEVWVVAAPWPSIVDDARTRGGLGGRFVGTPVSLARSPLVAVGADVDGCDWKCIGDGNQRLGAADLTSGLGTIELGALAGGFFGGPDFAANDFDAPFRSWLASLATRLTPDEQPVTRLLQSRAFFDVALSYEAEARTALEAATADRKAGLDLQYPAPVANLDVVAAQAERGALSGRARDLPSSLQRALRDLGWQEPQSTADGLPRSGVLIALRDLL